ncbi:hypothetical protein FSP39_008122 [Pinctada imbricata]|uniref:C2H2-type domain-containing protein n=1 Tax=Pinctada imbricata TaxID=66713 RepID=A0AA88XQT4_PINIB|nr:hypothetical protein FSP39_008122 [Pinctada imbricata]
MDTPDILDMEEYMDVVMTYKCRFCTFICSSIQEMGAHVKTMHLKGDNSVQVQQDNQLTTQQRQSMNDGGVSDSINPTDNSDQSASLISNTDQSAGIITDTGQSMNLKGENEKSNNMLENASTSTSGNENQFFQESQNSGQVNSSIGPIIDNLVDVECNGGNSQNLDVEIEKISASQAGDVLNGSNMTIPTITENGNMTFTIDGKTVELTVDNIDAGQSAEKGNKSQNVETLPGELTIVDESNCLGGENSETITKEVFLCGQCNIGFDTMDECRDHMFNDHEINVGDSDVEYETDGKISIGTQVEGKKRGRKRKGQTKANDDDDEDYRPKLEELEDSDVEWTIESEQSSRGSRTRRKIRPPKALENDYYIGKSKRRKETYEAQAQTLKKRDYLFRCTFEGPGNCYAKFSTSVALERHLKTHVEGDSLYKCYECPTVFQQWCKMRMHLWKNHHIDTDLLTCDICGIYKCDALSKLLIHKEIHGNDRPYTCDTCGKCFKQLSQMKNHQIIHEEVKNAGSEEKWYNEKKCAICKRVFANKKCLDKHIQAVHGKDKPFACTFCSYTSARKAMLQLHIRTHTQEKPCEICGYSCGDHNSMRRHRMRHSGQKPYKCKLCPYTCIQAISLKMHMKNKHFGINPEEFGVFYCDRCSFKSINEKIFKYHMEDHKNGLIPDGQPAANKVPEQRLIVTTTNPNILQQDGELVENALIQIQSEENEDDLASNQLEMQVQTVQSGETTTISAEDLAKITNTSGLVPSEVTAAQLITFALNAIAQNSNEDGGGREGDINGVQTSIDSSSTQDGVTMHTIRFHLPTVTDSANSASGQLNIDGETFKEGEIYQVTESELGRSVNSVIADTEVIPDGASNETVLLNYQGQSLPINVISLDQTHTLVNQSATIQDLAQVSCLVKESLNSGNTVVEISNQADS